MRMMSVPRRLVGMGIACETVSGVFIKSSGRLSRDAGMVSIRKCFTFGSEGLQQVVAAEMDHKKEFVIVGGSFVVGSDVEGAYKARREAV